MKNCFVVMGFGKKVCYETGRTLDLNATYETIIQPAVEAKGLRCIRADEITHSGIIDVKMYEMLLRADLVIADISTGNVNAVYELGVRHALRPNSTIIMKEDQGKLYFDLDHVSTFQYSHFGSDILGREAVRAVKDLGNLIEEAINAPHVDSPVYTYLPKLISPKMSDDEFADLVDEAEAAQRHLASLIREGELLMRKSAHVEAADRFKQVAELRPLEPDILQKWALNVYKGKKPDELTALRQALQILAPLTPEHSNDPETLGISGAINKNLWLFTNERQALDAAILFYRRGYEVTRNYYNGENLALCFEFRARIQEDRVERIFDFMSAHKVRESIISTLMPLEGSPDFMDRPDRRWIYATLANCNFACELAEQAATYENKFFGAVTAQWEIDTYQKAKAAILEISQERREALSITA